MWAYRFERPEGSVLAAWTVGEPASVALPADEGASAVDFMGRIASLEVASGQARLRVTQEPLYIVSP